MSNHENIEDAMAVICKALEPQAQIMASGTGRTLQSCLATLIRPMIGHYLHPETKSQGNKDVDLRERMWTVTIQFWDITQNIDRPDLLADNEGEQIRGLNTVIDVVREYADQMHEDYGVDDIPEFDMLKMQKRMHGMRPAISRGGGKATLRINYALEEHLNYYCSIDLERA